MNEDLIRNPKAAHDRTCDRFMLLDGRAWADEDDAAVLMTGTLAECREAQRDGDYGLDCYVAGCDCPTFAKHKGKPRV